MIGRLFAGTDDSPEFIEIYQGEALKYTGFGSIAA
jgi:IMP dehydrogenase/GMP reductase